MITIYEQTSAVRQRARSQNDQHAHALLLDATSTVDAPALKPRVRDLCQTIEAFVCIIDASSCVSGSLESRQQLLRAYHDEIRLLLNPDWTKYVSRYEHSTWLP